MDIAITSLSTPGVWFGDAALARQLSRLCNEFQAQMKVDFPGRFGSFAFLPLPDVQGALQELQYALDILGHDGVILLTDVVGRYLGDPDYEELFAEMDRRAVVVFIHPHTEPNRQRRYELFHPLLEWPIHTTRAVIDLLYSGRLSRYPNIRYILAHGGGTVPFLAERLGKAYYTKGNRLRWWRIIKDLFLKRNSGLELARRVSYDTAGSANPVVMSALECLVKPEQICFGSNIPWDSEAVVAESLRCLGRGA